MLLQLVPPIIPDITTLPTERAASTEGGITRSTDTDGAGEAGVTAAVGTEAGMAVIEATAGTEDTVPSAPPTALPLGTATAAVDPIFQINPPHPPSNLSKV